MSIASQPYDNSLANHVRRTLILAWPMVLSRVGIVTMSAIDVIFLGRAGAQELADYVLGQAIQDSLIAMTIGLLLGVPVLVARETGAGNILAAGLIWRRGLQVAIGFGVVLCGCLQFAETVYLAAGQAPDIAARASEVTRMLALGLPFIAIYYVCAAFLEAVHRPLLGTYVIVLGNFANAILNYVFVTGVGPVDPLGALGCAIATVLTWCLLAGVMVVLVRFGLRDGGVYGLWRRQSPIAGPSHWDLLRIGFASGGAFLFEASSFAVMTLFIGWLGALALAAHGVLFQFLALTFMVAYGIAGATQVRVGNAWGREDARGIALAGWTGLGLALVLTGAIAIAIACAPLSFIRIFTTDETVIAAVLPIMVWMLLIVAFDGGQSVCSNACRGRGDTWIPTILLLITYWGVMVPAAWIYTFALENGLAGIYQGILTASVVSLTLMAWRFWALNRARR